MMLFIFFKIAIFELFNMLPTLLLIYLGGHSRSLVFQLSLTMNNITLIRFVPGSYKIRTFIGFVNNLLLFYNGM